MQVKRFEAINMKEALAQIKREMGPDAVILSTRRIKSRSGLYGLGGKEWVEVTAALDEDRAEEAPSGIAEERLPLDVRERAGSYSSSSSKWRDVERFAALLDPLKNNLDDIKEQVRRNSGATMVSSGEEVKRELRELKDLVGQLVNKNRGEELRKDDGLGECYRTLLATGVKEEYIQNLIGSHEEMGEALLVEKFIESVKVGEPLSKEGYGPQVAAFVGPTGVGKTTTIAKITAGLVFSGRKVGLITIDTYRIAAVEQLKVYAGLIGSPVEVVSTHGELEGAIHRLRDKDCILIDTAGRSHYDKEQLEELGVYLKEKDIEIHLVLSAGMDERNLEKAIHNFSRSLPLDFLLFTKLDETCVLGGLYNHSLEKQIPLSYLTTGQRVPEDIELATAERVSSLLFRGEEEPLLKE